MYRTPTKFLKACSLSIMLLGSTAFVATLAVPDTIYAKGGNGNGGGNGAGNGGGNGGGNGNGNGNGNGGGNSDSGDRAEKSSSKRPLFGNVFKKSKSKRKVTIVRKTRTAPANTNKVKKPGGNKLARALGVHPSELGALNAANASPNALANASPNSRVGRIAAYRDEVLRGDALEAELAAKIELFDSLDPPARTVEEIDIDLNMALSDLQGQNDLLSMLEDDLAAAGGSDATIEADITTVKGDIQTTTDAINALQDEQIDVMAYDQLASDIDMLTQEVADQPALERATLEAAANKPVTDAVEDAVKALLGLETAG